jgi:hypothetical protein
MSTHDSDIGAVPAGGSSGDSEDLRDRSLPDLVKQLADQTSTLVRKEIDLAKAELAQKGKEAGKGAGMLGGAGVLALLAAIAFTAFLILILGTFLPDWLAALIVTVLYGAIAAVLALQGKKQLQSITPAPEQTIETVKEDVEWAKTQSRFAKK